VFTLKGKLMSTGTIVRNLAKGTWNLLYYPVGSKKRTSIKIGKLEDFVDERAVRREADRILEERKYRAVTVNQVAESFRGSGSGGIIETSRQTQETWLRNYVLPKWGERSIQEIRPKELKLWLESLKLAPLSKRQVKYACSVLFNHAMLESMIALGENPCAVFKMKGSRRRAKGKPKSIRVEQFEAFLGSLGEPFRTMALISLCVGLRVSECLALKWKDVDWLGGKLEIRRRIVKRRVNLPKTEDSESEQDLVPEILKTLADWRQITLWSGDEDWVFASHRTGGEWPYSRDWVHKMYIEAGKSAGIEWKVGTHSLRHTFRSWCDLGGETQMTVMKQLMRHSNLFTTMEVYGEVQDQEPRRRAFERVAGYALGRVQ
jgi:integrase